MKPATRARYATRIGQVLDYLYDHLDQEPDLYRLADIACLSPYHFHRIYRALMGESVAQTVRRARIHLASGELTRSNRPLPDVAQRAGYGSLAAFSRAFQQQFGTSPGRFRNHRLLALNPQESNMYPVTIRECPAFHIVALAHQGNYMKIGEAFDKLMLKCRSEGWLDESTRWLGFYYDDPATTPENELRSHAAASVSHTIMVEPPFEAMTIPAARCAVLRHTGPYSTLHDAYHWLFGHWLPQSGEQPAISPFEDYLNDPGSTPQQQLLTDIYLPLVPLAR
ncbi:AraC family transcriptional regulator [Chitiniphilus shinanonensis]|uniref:AraC family transcriptional regulator n=1 Tax=Chitiniphilus shinanonensis TaxID=553088 RepID=A0ABQ6BSQ4_9NEIS|nr:AraC family transcriptional regulator [Chitiniphilus shinanonensis]GLS04467.1 AraC family transcriptional regulator [Chitiniphilus shinanonensis]